MSECMVCERIELTKAGKNPFFVCELETGYVVIGDYQRFEGYTVFICKQHASELFQLENDFKIRFLDEMSIDHRYKKNDSEEYQCCCTCLSVIHLRKCVVDISYHSIKSARCTCWTHIIAEYTDDTGVLLEATDEAGDNNVRKHGREERNRDVCKHTTSRCAVNLCCIVILLVDTLKSAEENEDLKR